MLAVLDGFDDLDHRPGVGRALVSVLGQQSSVEHGEASDQLYFVGADGTAVPLGYLAVQDEDPSGLARFGLFQRRVRRGTVTARVEYLDYLGGRFTWAPAIRWLDAVVAMTRDLLQRARRPVLVVPPAHHEPVRVTAAFAGKELGPRVLRTAASLARGLDLPLTVYTAGPPAERERAAREARRVLTDLTPGIFQGCGGRAVEALLEQCRPRTLLVMGAFGSWSVRRLVMGSVSEKVMRGALGPVLLVHRSMRDKAE